MTDVQEANYAHALLHRYEGENVGEFSMRGWSNAAYRHDQTGSHENFALLQKQAEQTSAGMPQWQCMSAIVRVSQM